MISIVVAIDKNNVIGHENKIPWRLRSDLIRLNKLTKGHTVILGRKTYESMIWYYERSERKMPGETYIVVSRQDYQPAHNRPEKTEVVHSIPDAIKRANELGDEQIFAIGGAGIFQEILPQTDRIYLTRVDTEAEGDVFFPVIDMSEWDELSIEHHPQDEKNDHSYDLVVLERK
nr:Dihydrofolate reductase [uncultured bacterium]